jgi:hypothetical protein
MPHLESENEVMETGLWVENLPGSAPTDDYEEEILFQ